MSLRVANQLSLFLLKEAPKSFLVPVVNATNLQLVRHRRTKHWDPKWKKLRGLKVIKMELPNYRENPEDLSEDEIRSRMKERGIAPARPWMEKPIFISSTGGVFEPYVPPEGDGKISPITAQGAKQKLQFLEKKSKTMMAIRKIRSFEEEFDTPEFCKQAEEIYIKAHECMAANDEENIINYVTEKAYPEIMHNVKNKTIRWKYISTIELPRVVHARCTSVVSKENVFAQLTVRFHSQQSLAIYDRFGRLMHGSEIIAKDVLEYVVFEKHIANEYGLWRIHEKIIPDWLPPKEQPVRTLKIKPVKELEPEKTIVEQDTKIEATPLPPQESKPTLQV